MVLSQDISNELERFRRIIEVNQLQWVPVSDLKFTMDTIASKDTQIKKLQEQIKKCREALQSITNTVRPVSNTCEDIVYRTAYEALQAIE